MDSMARIVEESLKADARFRNLTVMSPVWTQEMLDRTEREGDEIYNRVKPLFVYCDSEKYMKVTNS